MKLVSFTQKRQILLAAAAAAGFMRLCTAALSPGNMIGPGAINTVMDEATYRKIRTIWNGELIPDSAMARHLPDISDKVNAYTDSWAAAKEVGGELPARILSAQHQICQPGQLAEPAELPSARCLRMQQLAEQACGTAPLQQIPNKAAQLYT